MELQASGRMVGFVGLSVPVYLPEILPSVEIGWRLAADQWGKGLATEGARAALDFGFGRVGLTRIVSIHQVGNGASGRTTEKLGMRLERKTVDPSCGRPVWVWRSPIWIGRRVGAAFGHEANETSARWLAHPRPPHRDARLCVAEATAR